MMPMNLKIEEQQASQSLMQHDCNMQMSSSNAANLDAPSKTLEVEVNHAAKGKHPSNIECCDNTDGIACCEIDCHCVAVSGAMVFLISSKVQGTITNKALLTNSQANNLLAPHKALPKRPPITIVF